MELKDTVNAMLSDDYKERMWAEYKQLEMRIEKMEKYIENSNRLCKVESDQLDAMRRYLYSLGRRCCIEGVAL